ncbi:RNA polymerase sigma-70 factor, ECF subfamily [Modicisalibacter muralis]|uniref:RNA polymerase sigma-70 factor, ECF subfamily n=1 Tax=Modicisalibacter muralis TaxID=119000 RepID=A0A1G9M8W5_9GAMM|nr:sigma-70 family RNA polymerase sigma factor [Halomonas muralis]SDL70553.1 RNA polymerase sigma-70 factor, ECF subfamily [Halomonas muralis]
MSTLDDNQLRELLPRLRRFALSLTQDHANADDLVQATLEKALSSWQQRHTDGDLRAWLFSILYRRFIDSRRRSKRYARLLELFTGDSPTSPSAEDIAVAHSALDAFEQLPAEQRALLMLVSVEGLSYREISDTLNIPMGTVMSRISRARKAMRALGEGEYHVAPRQDSRRTPPTLRRLK